MSRINKRTIDNMPIPDEGQTLLWDDKLSGFGIRILPSGTITFIVRYRTKSGRQRKMSLGRYGVVSSTWARNRALQILAEVSEGQDPASVEYETRHGNTFRALAEEYIERHCSKKKSGPIDIQMINKDLLPRWGSRPVKEINRRDVIKLVDSIHDRGAPIQANRTLSLIKRMFNFGIDRDIVESNPTTRVRPPGKENRRQRVLTDEEIRTVWGKLPEMNRAGILLEAAIKLILITAQRRGEIVALEWSEIDDNWWTIPEDKAKNGLTHRVPLSPLALSILEELPRDGQYVFPRRTGRGHIESNHMTGRAVTRAVSTNRELFGIPHWTPHDLRRTAASGLAHAGVSRTVIGKILNHAEPSVTAVYDRHGYDAEKRAALDAWGEKIGQILRGKGANVVPMVK